MSCNLADMILKQKNCSTSAMVFHRPSKRIGCENLTNNQMTTVITTKNIPSCRRNKRMEIDVVTSQSRQVKSNQATTLFLSFPASQPANKKFTANRYWERKEMRSWSRLLGYFQQAHPLILYNLTPKYQLWSGKLYKLKSNIGREVHFSKVG